MKFSEKQLKELENILKKDYGVLINDTDLKEFADKITRLAYISYKHMLSRQEIKK